MPYFDVTLSPFLLLSLGTAGLCDSYHSITRTLLLYNIYYHEFEFYSLVKISVFNTPPQRVSFTLIAMQCRTTIAHTPTPRTQNDIMNFRQTQQHTTHNHLNQLQIIHDISAEKLISLNVAYVFHVSLACAHSHKASPKN